MCWREFRGTAELICMLIRPMLKYHPLHYENCDVSVGGKLHQTLKKWKTTNMSSTYNYYHTQRT